MRYKSDNVCSSTPRITLGLSGLAMLTLFLEAPTYMETTQSTSITEVQTAHMVSSS